MRKVGESGSLNRVRRFLERHPEMLNEYACGMTFLGIACDHGFEDIAEYLISLPNIDLSLGWVGHRTPLDLALSRSLLGGNRTKIIRMLVAVGAPSSDQHELDEFLETHPTLPVSKRKSESEEARGGKEDQTWSWIRTFVFQQLEHRSLKEISADEIKQMLQEGHLPCGWTHDLAWKQIWTLTENQRSLKESLQIEKTRLDAEEQRSTDELQKVQEQRKQLDKNMQQQARLVSGVDLEMLSAFAQRVEPIENALMSELESELEKKKPKLSALTDLQSPQPKLSLFLNCMGTHSKAIHATRDLDSTMFQRQVKNSAQFIEQYGSAEVSEEMLKDLLYCGEMLRDCNPPLADHDDKCPVCLNRTPEELTKYLREKGIDLDSNTIRRNRINGRRVLFSMAKEFSNAATPTQALDRLRDIHEDAMSSEPAL